MGKSGAFIFRGKKPCPSTMHEWRKTKKSWVLFDGGKKGPPGRSRSAELANYPALDFTPPSYPQNRSLLQ